MLLCEKPRIRIQIGANPKTQSTVSNNTTSNKANLLTFGSGEWKGTRLVESDAAAVVEVVAEVVVVGF